ncbi:MAG: TlpA disulfide reductase family protein, partial [Bacteroidales bacterium]|nr:TlpA disulfide reductase family protein [Bacteroidales bacterium]
MKTRFFYIIIILLFAGSTAIALGTKDTETKDPKFKVLSAQSIQNQQFQNVQNPAVINQQNPEVRNLQIKGFPSGVQVVALGNLCPDGTSDELILGSDSTLYICTVAGDSVRVLYSHCFDKPVLKLRTGDADNDGKNDLVLITGYTQYTDSEVNVYVVKYCDEGSGKNIEKSTGRPVLGSVLLFSENSAGRSVKHSNNNNSKWSVTPVYTKASPRPQPLYLEIADIDNDGNNEIIASYYESKYIVETVLISFDSEKKGEMKPDSVKPDSTQLESESEESGSGIWNSEVFLTERMSTAFDIGKLRGVKLGSDKSGNEIFSKDKNLLFVGRVYGDSLGDEGDAYILDDNLKTNLKVRRGVKSAIKIGDGDNDGKKEIYMGDGWHQNYGKIARGRLAVIGEDLTYRLIEDIKGQSNLEQIDITDIDGDCRNEVLTAGNRFFRIYRYTDVDSGETGTDISNTDTGGWWEVFKDTLSSSDTLLKPDQFAVGHINEDGIPDLVFAGKLNRRDRGVRVFNLKNLTYSDKLDKEVVTEVVNPDSLLNKPAPELIMDRWCNGNFEGIRKSSGKVIVLDFWATWCQPCKRMFPALRELHDKYRERGLIIAGVTKVDASQNVAAIEKYVREENFNYLMGISEETVNDLAYGVGVIPHTVLVDKNGGVRK